MLKNFSYFSKVQQYYSGTIDAINGHEKVKWGSRELQYLRFSVLAEIERGFFDSSILDYGCGIGSLVDFLSENKFSGEYVGYDILPEMIDRAKELHVGYTFISKMQKCSVDYVVSSGIFTTADLDIMQVEIKNAFSLSKKGLAFNSLSSWGSQKEDGEFCADPIKTLEFCSKLTSRVVLRHDYLPHDFTIYMYK